MMGEDQQAQEKVVEYFLSHAKGVDDESQLSACMARLSATDMLHHYGKFMKAERGRPNQHPGHTIGALANFLGMMMAYAIDTTTTTRKPGADIEKLADDIAGVFKTSCLMFLKAAIKMDEENG